jgi:hypothetical protein
MELDVREVLGSVEAPTLVLGKAGDQIAPLEGAKVMAAGIPNAIFKELPPGDHLAGDPEKSPRPSSTSSSARSPLCRRRTGRWRPSCSRTSSARPKR